MEFPPLSVSSTVFSFVKYFFFTFFYIFSLSPQIVVSSPFLQVFFSLTFSFLAAAADAIVKEKRSKGRGRRICIKLYSISSLILASFPCSNFYDFMPQQTLIPACFLFILLLQCRWCCCCCCCVFSSRKMKTREWVLSKRKAQVTAGGQRESIVCHVRACAGCWRTGKATALTSL